MAKEDGNEVGTVNGEYVPPDAVGAIEHHDKYIRPNTEQIAGLRGDCSEPWQHIKKVMQMPRPVMNFLLNLRNMDDDAKRDHSLLALHLGLEALGFRVPTDLVALAQGTANGSIVPSDDVAGGEALPGFDEASDEELAQQQTRPSTEKGAAHETVQ